MKWINAREHQPETATDVLIAMTYHPQFGPVEFVDIGWYDADTRSWLTYDMHTGTISVAVKVSHWMPLPAYPTQSNQSCI